MNFNIRADKLISKTLQTNVIYTSMSVYLKYQRILNKYHIESKLEERIQKIFMMWKYNWYVQTYEDIQWELQAKFI